MGDPKNPNIIKVLEHLYLSSSMDPHDASAYANEILEIAAITKNTTVIDWMTSCRFCHTHHNDRWCTYSHIYKAPFQYIGDYSAITHYWQVFKYDQRPGYNVPKFIDKYDEEPEAYIYAYINCYTCGNLTTLKRAIEYRDTNNPLVFSNIKYEALRKQDTQTLE